MGKICFNIFWSYYPQQKRNKQQATIYTTKSKVHFNFHSCRDYIFSQITDDIYILRVTGSTSAFYRFTFLTCVTGQIIDAHTYSHTRNLYLTGKVMFEQPRIANELRYQTLSKHRFCRHREFQRNLHASKYQQSSQLI